MGTTKTDLFSDHQNQLAMAAKALAHPARIAIIQHLIKLNTCINSDLVEELGLAQATVSQHLRELKDAGIIRGTIEGTRMNYCLHPGRWAELKALFGQFFEHNPSISANTCC